MAQVPAKWGEREKKNERRAEIKRKAHTLDCVSRLLHSSIWVDMANIITQKLTVLLCRDTAEPRDGSKGEEGKKKPSTVIKVGKGAKKRRRLDETVVRKTSRNQTRGFYTVTNRGNDPITASDIISPF